MYNVLGGRAASCGKYAAKGDNEKFALRLLRQLRQSVAKVSKVSIISCYFFIHSVPDLLNTSGKLPLIIPADGRCTRYTL